MTDPIIDPDLVEHLDDATLLRACRHVDVESGDSGTAALLAEIRRRNLDPRSTVPRRRDHADAPPP